MGGPMAAKKQGEKSPGSRQEIEKHPSRRSRRIWLGLGAVAGLALLLAGIARLALSPSIEGAARSGATGIFHTEWSKGDPDAPLTLVEYSDFQCPACGAYYRPLKRLHAEFGDRLRFVYRHFPLRFQHPHAKLAAQAAEAAGKQNRFWEMHDLIFERQEEWSPLGDPRERFVHYARQLGLDLQRFQADLDATATRIAVESDFQSGTLLGVSATPTFFLNGERIPTPRNYDELKGRIEQAIAVISK